MDSQILVMISLAGPVTTEAKQSVAGFYKLAALLKGKLESVLRAAGTLSSGRKQQPKLEGRMLCQPAAHFQGHGLPGAAVVPCCGLSPRAANSTDLLQ